MRDDIDMTRSFVWSCAGCMGALRVVGDDCRIARPSTLVAVWGQRHAPRMHWCPGVYAYGRGNTAATAQALIGAIYQSCTYEPGCTDSSTTADAVLARRLERQQMLVAM